MRIWIPTIGDMLRLTAEWRFVVKPDYRNADIYPLFEDYEGMPQVAIMPEGTVLKVERIYIRSSYRRFDSLTFRTVASPDPRMNPKKVGGKGKSVRFFAHLSDVNKMEAEPFNVRTN